MYLTDTLVTTSLQLLLIVKLLLKLRIQGISQRDQWEEKLAMEFPSLKKKVKYAIVLGVFQHE